MFAFYLSFDGQVYMSPNLDTLPSAFLKKNATSRGRVGLVPSIHRLHEFAFLSNMTKLYLLSLFLNIEMICAVVNGGGCASRGDGGG